MIIFGDGLNTSAQKLGYDPLELVVGSVVQIPEWDEELGDYYENYQIYEINNTDEGIIASVHYTGDTNIRRTNELL